MKYMLDTNIVIFAQKGNPNVLSHIREKYQEGLCISAITLAELEYGVYNSQNVEKNLIALEKMLSLVDVLPFDDYAAIEYGKIYAGLKKKGTVIGTMDALIAAHARSLKLIVATNNEKEFCRVENLKIEDWLK